jgi:branched-subunit amino acid transport protein
MNFLAIVIVGIGTYIFRAAFIVGFAERELSAGFVRALEFVGPAVLSALVVALLVGESGGVELGVQEVAGLLAGGLVGWKTRNLIYTVLAGMIVFWLLGALLA